METIGSLSQYISDELRGVIEERELKSFSVLLFDYLRGYSLADLITRKEEKVTDDEVEYIKKAVRRLRQNEPIQYVVGSTEFYGLIFNVDERALIPRPETEELVEWVLTENTFDKFRLLDIGTGSGCIPISIKKNRPNSIIEAWDVSAKALNLARKNAVTLDVEVVFKLQDVLSLPESIEPVWDVIVSNPPYITEKEKKLMASNVLDYEPHLALFVADCEPLLFYNAIADYALKSLNKGGRIYFEINEAYGQQVCDALTDRGFENCELRKDLFGRYRMVRATLAI